MRRHLKTLWLRLFSNIGKTKLGRCKFVCVSAMRRMNVRSHQKIDNKTATLCKCLHQWCCQMEFNINPIQSMQCDKHSIKILEKIIIKSLCRSCMGMKRFLHRNFHHYLRQISLVFTMILFLIHWKQYVKKKRNLWFRS